MELEELKVAGREFFGDADQTDLEEFFVELRKPTGHRRAVVRCEGMKNVRR
jgi:hypothetical protein